MSARVERIEPGLRLSIGVSGSGKTFGLRRQVYMAIRQGTPVIALDRLKEWKTLPGDVAKLAVGVEGGTDRIAAAARWVEKGARLVIVRVSSESIKQDFENVCAWARDNPAHCGIAVSEAHRVAPNSSAPLPEAVEDVALAWRHHVVSLWTDTQRLSLLHRTFTEMVRELRVYGVGGELDGARLRELGGRELQDAAAEAARRLLPPSKGGWDQPGWHVHIERVALPPYTLIRS